MNKINYQEEYGEGANLLLSYDDEDKITRNFI